MKIIVETSARHVHLTKQDLEILFGTGAELTAKKELSQRGQFACEERVTIVGPKGEISGVTIIGPARGRTQVELSLTDARKIGIQAPIRESGHLEGTPGCKIVGPNGEITTDSGVIVSKRHIHLDPKSASEINVRDKQTVSIKIENECRSTIFGDVVVRVREDFSPALHIDTDESNACCAGLLPYGEIIL